MQSTQELRKALDANDAYILWEVDYSVLNYKESERRILKMGIVDERGSDLMKSRVKDIEMVKMK